MTDFTEILNIAGKGGLHRLVGKSKTSLIVESLDTGKRFPVFGTHQVSTLEEIAMYTDNGEKPLKEVFRLIFDKEQGLPAPEPSNDPAALREYFALVLPDFDRDRVFLSDIKKVVKWYNQLLDKKILEFEELAPESESKEELS
jgi:hypothetical protein